MFSIPPRWTRLLFGEREKERKREIEREEREKSLFSPHKYCTCCFNVLFATWNSCQGTMVLGINTRLAVFIRMKSKVSIPVVPLFSQKWWLRCSRWRPKYVLRDFFAKTVKKTGSTTRRKVKRVWCLNEGETARGEWTKGILKVGQRTNKKEDGSEQKKISD